MRTPREHVDDLCRIYSLSHVREIHAILGEILGVKSPQDRAETPDAPTEPTKKATAPYAFATVVIDLGAGPRTYSGAIPAPPVLPSGVMIAGAQLLPVRPEVKPEPVPEPQAEPAEKEVWAKAPPESSTPRATFSGASFGGVDLTGVTAVNVADDLRADIKAEGNPDPDRYPTDEMIRMATVKAEGRGTVDGLALASIEESTGPRGGLDRKMVFARDSSGRSGIPKPLTVEQFRARFGEPIGRVRVTPEGDVSIVEIPRSSYGPEGTYHERSRSVRAFRFTTLDAVPEWGAESVRRYRGFEENTFAVLVRQRHQQRTAFVRVGDWVAIYPNGKADVFDDAEFRRTYLGAFPAGPEDFSGTD